MSPIKILRTGDFVLNKNTGKKGKLHYIGEKSGQMVFERKVSEVAFVEFDDGNNIIDLGINEIDSIRR